MSIRISTSGRTYVQELDVPIVAGSFLPLLRSQLDMESIKMDPNVVDMVLEPLATISKGDRVYEGILVERTDRIATIDQDLYRMSVRGWDQIQEPRYIQLSRPVQGSISMSFITTGIVGQVVHHLYLGSRTDDGGVLETNVLVENRMPLDLDGVQVEVMTAEEVRAFRTQALAMDAAPMAAPSQGESGTIYTLDGTYDLPSNTQISLPMLRSKPQLFSYYVIDVTQNEHMMQGIQVIRITPTMDLPSGSLYVYRNAKLIASTSLTATGQGQEREISILRIPSISATGNVIIDTMETQDEAGYEGEPKGVDRDTITIEGTLRNSLPIQILVYLRYYVGTAKIISRGVSNGPSYQRQGPYLLFPHSMNPNSTQPYSHTFTIQH